MRNTGRKALRVQAIRWVSDFPRTGKAVLQFPTALRPFYFATENYRGDYFGTGTTRGGQFFKPLPHEPVTLGLTEDFSFPGVFVGAQASPVGLLCAAASRDRLHAFCRLYGGNGRGTWNFEIEERPFGIDALAIPAGETMRGERFFFQIVETNDPQQATDAYYAFLRRQGLFARRRLNPLPRQRIWGSWNFGYFDKITAADVLKQLPVIRTRFPGVRFVQLDDGYQSVCRDGQRAGFDFLYKTKTPHNPVTFPDGLDGLARAIKAGGLRPAIWIGLWTVTASRMIVEHPDWVARDDMGRPQTLGRMCVLDPSAPGVRKYFEKVCKTVFDDWGYEGLKLDFYSFAFQNRRLRYRDSSWTAAELWKWYVQTIRKHLPQDGFLGLGSVAGTGTPFYGDGPDYFRMGEDISNGDWSQAKTIALWCANTNMLLQQRPVLANVDSIGWSPTFNETEWKSFLNLCAIGGGALEVGGDLTKLDDNRTWRLARTLDLSDPSRRVWCLDLPAGAIDLPPAIWVAEGRRDKLIGIFNWSDRDGTMRLDSLDRLWPGWRRKARLVWPDETLKITSAGVALAAHESAVFRLNVYLPTGNTAFDASDLTEDRSQALQKVELETKQ